MEYINPPQHTDRSITNVINERNHDKRRKNKRNLEIPYNFWLQTHYRISSWNNEVITDKTQAETFVRRYNFLMIDYEYNVNDTGIYLIINNYGNI